jgi:hypothetical protein
VSYPWDVVRRRQRTWGFELFINIYFLVSYPWDVVRRRQQTWGFAPGTDCIAYLGTTETLRRIIQTEGFFGMSVVILQCE